MYIPGKSTLLDVLSGRLESKNLTGTITTNGVPVNKSVFRKQSGYVMQSDALFPLLTVRESIRYAAYLRCKNKSNEEKDAAVDEIINVLRLGKCADTRVGNDDTRGISGGEKRRVSIAVDIVHMPSVIFLDEPTSGLVRVELSNNRELVPNKITLTIDTGLYDSIICNECIENNGSEK